MLNLDAQRSARAAKREGGTDHLAVLFAGETYELPVELPAAVVDALLDNDAFDLGALLQSAVGIIRDQSAEEAARDEAMAAVVETLLAQPTLPLDVVRAIRGAIAALFGAEQWTRFQAARPSLPDMAALVRGLWTEYGVSLGEAFGSSAPSGTAGTTSKQTSSSSGASTPAVPGLTPATPAS